MNIFSGGDEKCRKYETVVVNEIWENWENFKSFNKIIKKTREFILNNFLMNEKHLSQFSSMGICYDALVCLWLFHYTTKKFVFNSRIHTHTLTHTVKTLLCGFFWFKRKCSIKWKWNVHIFYMYVFLFFICMMMIMIIFNKLSSTIEIIKKN